MTEREAAAPSLEVYRQTLDALLDQWSRVSGIEVKAKQQRVGRLVYGWVAHVHELARVVRDLVDNGDGHASLYLTRSMLEHTVLAHWLRLTGDRGVDALLTIYRQSMQTLEEDARAGPFELPKDFVDELSATSLTPVISEQTIARRFNKVCADLGITSTLYAGYRMASQFLHPSFLVASVYATPDGEAMLERSALNDHGGDVAMAAHCLIWSGRTLDELTPGKPRKKELRELAKQIRCAPMLPERTTGKIVL